MNLNKHVLIGFGIGLVAGVGLGVVVSDKASEAKYRAIADEEVEAVRRAFALKRDTDRKPRPGESKAEYKERVADLQYFTKGGEEVTEEFEATEEEVEELRKRVEVEESIATADNIDKEPWSEKDEIMLEHRSEDVPFVITTEEFEEESYSPRAGEEDVYPEKLSITYFEGDDTLVDERNQIIPHPEDIVGNGLQRFGAGSDNPHIVYVRNAKLGTDFEIAKDENSYANWILGRDSDWENEDLTPVLKMRDDG